MLDSFVILFHKECYYIKTLLGLIIRLFRYMIRSIHYITGTYMQTGLPFFDKMTEEQKLNVLEHEVSKFPSKEESTLLLQAQAVKEVQDRVIRVSRKLDLE